MHMTPATPGSVAAFLGIVAGLLGLALWGSYAAVRRQGGDAGKARLATRSMAIRLALWVAATSLPVVSGVLSARPFPGIPLFFGTIVGASLLFGLSKTGRLLSALPFSALVGFQAFRLPLELVLHSWAGQRTIPETMTWSGSNFDIVSGVTALIFAPLAARSVMAAWTWNLIGIALLVNVARVAMLSSAVPFGWHVQPPLELALHMPYALVATVCVAMAVAGHAISPGNC
jgi:hypothetical protein